MNEISPKVASTVMHENHTLTITFENEEMKTFDLNPYLRYEVFEPLKDFEEFKNFMCAEKFPGFRGVLWSY